MKKLAVALLTVAAAAVAPVAVAPVAQADICAGAHGRHVGVGGCTNIAGDVAAVAIASAADACTSRARCRATPSKVCRTTPLPATPAEAVDGWQ